MEVYSESSRLTMKNLSPSFPCQTFIIQCWHVTFCFLSEVAHIISWALLLRVWIFAHACLHPYCSFHQPKPSFNPCTMAFLQQMRSPRLSFIQTLVSLFLGGVALMSSYWCVGKQKVPKPLCSPIKHSNCIPVPGVSNSSNIQISWETGDDRFVFPTFHTGLFVTCEENIYTDAWGERGGK